MGRMHVHVGKSLPIIGTWLPCLGVTDVPVRRFTAQERGHVLPHDGAHATESAVGVTGRHTVLRQPHDIVIVRRAERHVTVHGLVEDVHINVAADAGHGGLRRVLPSARGAVVGERVIELRVILRDPLRACLQPCGVEPCIHVVEVAVDVHVTVAGCGQFAEVGACDALVLRGRRWHLVAAPIILFKVVENRKRVVGDPILAQQLNRPVALFASEIRIVGIAVVVDAEGDLQCAHLRQIPCEPGILEPIAVADAQDDAVDARVLHLVPIDVPLMLGDIDHFECGVHQRAVRLQEGLVSIVRACGTPSPLRVRCGAARAGTGLRFHVVSGARIIRRISIRPHVFRIRRHILIGYIHLRRGTCTIAGVCQHHPSYASVNGIIGVSSQDTSTCPVQRQCARKDKRGKRSHSVMGMMCHG